MPPARFPRLVRGLLAAGLLLAALSALGALFGLPAGGPPLTIPGAGPFPLPEELRGVELLKQTAEEAQRKSAGCVACHLITRDPHFKDTLRLGCVDCHG